MRSEDDWKVVAIEVETGDYEIGKDEIDAAHRLRVRHPEAPFWFRYYRRALGTMNNRTASEREEFGRRGDEIYERDIVPLLGPEDQGKIAAIDVETGDYEIAGEELAAADRLLTRRPEAQIWLRRIGSRYLYRFGVRHTPAE